MNWLSECTHMCTLSPPFTLPLESLNGVTFFLIHVDVIIENVIYFFQNMLSILGHCLTTLTQIVYNLSVSYLLLCSGHRG